MLTVHVINHGRGFRQKDIQKIFKLFEQEQGQASKDANLMEESGLTMNLDICKKIVEINGGFISVFSEGENRGSTFMFGMKMEVPDDCCEFGSPV